MGGSEGALADAATRRALLTYIVVAVATFALGIPVVTAGAVRLGTGEDDTTALGIALAGLGALLLASGVRRMLRAARTNTVLSAHRWEPWTLMGIYPARNLIAVARTPEDEEHLVRLDRWGSRRLRRERRRSQIYLAGDERWWVVTPVEGRRVVALGRMDVPYRRFRLVNPVSGLDEAPPEPGPEEPGPGPRNGSDGP